MAFSQRDGEVVWKSGDFLISEAPPLLIDLEGQEQLVVLGGGTINGIDPVTGRVLWTHPPARSRSRVHDRARRADRRDPLAGARVRSRQSAAR
jgi:hypothetical protein